MRESGLEVVMPHWREVPALLAFGLLVGIAGESSAVAFAGVGDLPGGKYWSSVAGLSADGTTAVGSSFSGSGREAFRLRGGHAIEGLGDLVGGDFSSQAVAASADGSTIVGAATAGNISWDSAFRWTEATAMEDIPDPAASGIPRYATAVSVSLMYDTIGGITCAAGVQ